jgi:hypothetical protein
MGKAVRLICLLLLLVGEVCGQSSGIVGGGVFGGKATGGASPVLIQNLNCNCKNTSTHCVINTSGSAQCNNTPTLTTTGTGHLVIALCGADSNDNCVSTGPVSTPSATWSQLASNTHQDQAWYTCSSAAFTAIDFGPFSQQDAVIEFSGVNTSSCLDKNPALLGQNTTSWATNASGTTAQGHELVVGWVTQFTATPGYACGGAYTQAVLGNGTSSALIACYAVETATGSYTVSGTATTAASSQEAGVYTFEYP